MNRKALQILSTLLGLSLIVGCAAPGPRAPILKPQLIDQIVFEERLDKLGTAPHMEHRTVLFLQSLEFGHAVYKN